MDDKYNYYCKQFGVGTDDSDEDDTIDKEAILKIQTEFREKNVIDFVEADIRNVVFCGTSRSGKTTACRILQDLCYSPERPSLFSEDREITCKTFSLKTKQIKEVEECILTLIDTPGFYEVRSYGEVRSYADDFMVRGNDELCKQIAACLECEVNYLNLLVICLPMGSKVDSIHVDSIELIMKMFGDCNLPIVLCLTHADEQNAKSRKLYEKEIKIHPRLVGFFKQPNISVLFSGCVNFSSTDIFNEAELIKRYEEIKKWRLQFIAHIFQSSEKIPLANTNLFKSVVELNSSC